MRKWRWLAVMLAAMAVAVVGFAQPASAGNGWQPCGWVCDDEDPNTYMAWDSVRLEIHPCYTANVRTVATIMGTELRYSPECETTWGRQVYSCSCQLVRVWIRSWDAHGYLRNQSSAKAPSNSNVTVMMDDHGLYNEVCLQYTDENAGDNWACSKRF